MQLTRLLVLVASGRAAALTGCAVPSLSPMLRPTVPAMASAVQMGAVPVASFDGATSGEEEVALKVAKAGAYVVHRKVVAEQANMRLGTAAAKTRAEVRGGGRKPYQQKGTGRARRGSSRSPLLVGGGKSFGPRQKSYHIKMNKKEKQLALSTALMGALPRMTLINELESQFTAPKTAEMRAFLERLGTDTSGKSNTMMILKERHENTYLSARNIPYLNLKTLDNLNARDILRAKKLVVSQSAMATLKDRYGE
jgi:large subunit ribosomal protein L4